MDPDDVRRHWAEREGEYSPAYYAYRGADETSERIRVLLAHFVGRDASVLEVGCGSGRHLAHLRADGFENLSGVDINEGALDVMRAEYPALARAGTFYFDDVVDVLPAFEDDAFDAVFTVETLQHIHPDDERVFDELARVTGDLLVTVENERDGDRKESETPAVAYVNDEFPLFFRDWRRIFTERGFVEVEVKRGEKDTLRAFRRPGK